LLFTFINTDKKAGVRHVQKIIFRCGGCDIMNMLTDEICDIL